MEGSAVFSRGLLPCKYPWEGEGAVKLVLSSVECKWAEWDWEGEWKLCDEGDCLRGSELEVEEDEQGWEWA